MRNLVFAAVSLLALAGCYLFHRAPGDAELPVDAAQPGCVTRTLRAGERFAPVDMVWVVDSSRSMADEQMRITQTMSEFVAQAAAREFDLRLVMVTEDEIVPEPLRSDGQRYRFVPRAVASHAPLTALLEAWPRYADFLREDAALHFVIVTDDDSELSADEFTRRMDRLVAQTYTVHAVASPDVGGEPCQSARPSEACARCGARCRGCGAAAVGREYYALAERSGGEEISICVDDWQEVFGPLLEAVTPTSIPCTIELGPDPELTALRVELRIDASEQPLRQLAGPRACAEHPVGFYYRESVRGAQLELCPQACEATARAGAELEIASHCE